MSTGRAAFFATAAVAIAALATVAALHTAGWRLVRVPAAAQPAPAATFVRSCVDVFQPGQPVRLGDARCLGRHGELHVIGWHPCVDGRRLATVTANTGAPAGFGFDSDLFVAAVGELAADPRFAAAMDECYGR